MRLVVDLQACQTEASRGRGVGRYSEALAGAIAAGSNGDDIRGTLNGAFPDTLMPLIDQFAPGLRQSRVSFYRYPSVSARGPGETTTGTQVAEALVRRHWLALQPDVLHLSHLCEGFTGEAVVPARLPQASGLVRSATLYDLIPLRFPEHYLADPNFSRWYLRCIGVARTCDHLLAISESTRQDAIELLGIEPSRVTTIWGDAGAQFSAEPVGDDEAHAFRRRWRLNHGFVLYTGGDEYRKNVDGAIAAFAALPPEVRRNRQLVIVCAISEASRDELTARSRRLALHADELILTGHVSERDLVTFYRLCDAFVFPSLYEGFGLPVLEAMKCGAPTVAGDNSSVREILGRQDALFDARRPEAIAERLARVLSDSGFANDLRRHGLERSKAFSWERSAAIALHALHEASRAARPGIVSVSVLPLRRLAVFTPLPPCRSGIADYSAALLPYLARHFDIDIYIDDHPVDDQYLAANFRIRSHREFEARRHRYDAVVYDIGNSEFHAYMLEHLAREPGIVVLHDAFLSGLHAYLEFQLGHAGHYTRTMLDAHGPRARRFFAPAFGEPDPIGAAVVALPATRDVLRQARGVISHSKFNLDIAREQYPEGWAAPYRIINQIVRTAPATGDAARRAARAALGIGEGEFVVCTFGHVAWNKCGDVLLDAFKRSNVGASGSGRLVFAGELAKDAFGQKLKHAIRQGSWRRQVSITGYLPEADYVRHLEAADVAVQLRTHSRGGTPKGVLDCLARGIPVVVNDAASYRDYPKQVVARISAEPEAEELSLAIDALASDRERRQALGAAGRAYVQSEHGPERIAAQYALSIIEFMQRARPLTQAAELREFGALIADDAQADGWVGQIAAARESQLADDPFQRERLLVDVTHISGADHGTGVPRVVRNIVKWLYGSRRAGFDAVAVRLDGGRLFEAVDWLASQRLLAPPELHAARPPIEPRWGDRLLMLDSSWARIDEFLPVYEDVRRAGGKVYTVVYDLLPIQFPQYMVEGGPAWFRSWLDRAIGASDGIVCISRAVADQLIDHIEQGDAPLARSLPVGFWHLGGDFRADAPVSPPSARIERALMGTALVMIGSIDPRKNHPLALDAFERLWSRGVDARLCIAGKPGWMVEELIKRIERHPERDRRLHYIVNPTDDELAFCYRNAAGLLFASAGEGFGLPLVEAARWGTPLLVSDLPVLREIAGEHATYFDLGDADSLAAAIEHWLAERAAGRVPSSLGMRCLTWEASTEALLEVVLDGRWYKIVGVGAQPNTTLGPAAGPETE